MNVRDGKLTLASHEQRDTTGSPSSWLKGSHLSDPMKVGKALQGLHADEGDEGLLKGATVCPDQIAHTASCAVLHGDPERSPSTIVALQP